MLVIAPLLLTACSMDYPVQDLLDGYAAHAADRELLGQYLADKALTSALDSLDLLDSLGLTQVGIAEFHDVHQIGTNLFAGCLDVSGVGFMDSAGDSVQLAGRQETISVSIWFTGSSGARRISAIETGEPC